MDCTDVEGFWEIIKKQMENETEPNEDGKSAIPNHIVKKMFKKGM